LAQSGGSPYAGPARECAYNGAVTTNNVGAPCTDAESTANPYSILQKRVCTPGSFPVTPARVWTVVDNCSTDPTSVTDATTLINVATNTQCNYRAPVVTNTATCAPVATSGASPFVTAITCPITDTGWVAVAPTCTPIGILGSLPATPPTLDGTGKAVGCQSTDTTTYTVDYPSGPVPVASCTAGTDAGTKVQTTCTDMTNTSAPVASCTPISPATAPSYLLTTCSTTTTSSNVMGCSPSAPTSPLFQTITCVDNGDGTSNTLADVAAYYYKTDLRTPALNNCIGAIVAPATSGSVLCTAADPMNNVPTTATDTNAAQHMTTFTLGLGVSGYMKYSATYNSDATGDFPTVKGVAPYAPANGISADPSNGVCPWQSTGLCNWPAPAADEQTAVDDLWHAGVNGRGAYFSATDPVSLGNSISSTLAQVAAAGGVAAAGTVSSPVLTPADSYVFMGSYKSVDWTGELIRVTLDPFSGLPSTTIDWSAQAKLDAKAYSARNIWTFDSSIAVTKLKAFTSANFATNSYFLAPHISGASTGLTQFVCSAADICLSAVNQDSSHASGANLVNYLRGERTNEGAETDNTKYYRQRANVLGDIVNAQVAYVPPPFYEYVDPGYDAFKTAQASRLAMVYVGANDGMLHAFAAKGSAATETAVTAAANAQAAATLNPTDAAAATAAATASAAATAALSGDTQIGQEQWAYIPSKMLPNLYRLADKKYRDKHRYFVDSTPVIGDVCTANCTNAASAVWRTILVGGLGRGGRGYYALDITDPANPKALWEFSDTNMGYTYGPAQIAKMANGTWVVLLSSGYNNMANDDGAGGDGVGRMYIVNAGTGVEIPSLSPMTTGVGSTTTPSGLGKLSAQVVNPATDATIGAVYAGDLLGNLWRFDINDTVGVAGTEAFKLAWLKDVSGVGQPITTLPIVSKARGKYIVLVGTGQLLAASDSATTAQQTLYGIIDDRVASQTTYDNPGGATTRGSNLDFVQQTLTEVDCPTDAITEGLCVLGERVFLNSSNAVDYAAKKGWFMDFIVTGERVNTDPVLALGLLAMNTAVPSLAACDVGGKTYQHWIDYQTGGALSTTNVSGIKAYDLLTAGLTAFVVPDGVKLGTPIGVRTFDVNVPPGSAAGKPTRRNSWRELIRE
jgi:type IV pilus assembly protein PilY1